jgi:peptidyl-prolyl cis-trans isomerase B (cyclophilin B)
MRSKAAKIFLRSEGIITMSKKKGGNATVRERASRPEDALLRRCLDSLGKHARSRSRFRLKKHASLRSRFRLRMKHASLRSRFCLLFFFAAVFFATAAPAQSPQPTPPKKSNARPAPAPKALVEPYEKATVETMRAQCVRLETEKGAIELELYPESAPETVRNFLNLVALGAYDGTIFYRVVPNFVVQGGSGGVEKKIELVRRMGRTIRDEPSLIRHERGILSMARPDEPNGASSDFFILVRTAPHLDGTFAAFGRVTAGMETVDAINKMPVAGDKPEKPVSLARAAIYPCPAAAKP